MSLSFIPLAWRSGHFCIVNELSRLSQLCHSFFFAKIAIPALCSIISSSKRISVLKIAYIKYIHNFLPYQFLNKYSSMPW